MEPVAVERVEARFELDVGPSEGSLRMDGRAAVERAGDIVDACVATADFDCCYFRAGLELTVDGRSWTEQTFDHLWHLGGWFHGVRAALASGEGAEDVRTYVWDESSLLLSRAGDRILLSDEQVASGRYGARAADAAWMPIAVPDVALVRELVREGRAMQAAAGAIRREIERRGFSLAALAARIAPRGDMPRAALGDHELVLAILAREVDVGHIWDDVDALAAWLVTRGA
ncbi:MAG TPA: hypothetical protein VN903_18785 [Polyangia bacterium]|nr:hypothetical protein [Polyangia bacterium]